MMTINKNILLMSNRRKFITSSITGLAGITMLPAINTFAETNHQHTTANRGDFKLRFAIASDGHYAQPDTDSDTFYTNLVNWLNKEHHDNHLDLIIINGDLV